MHIIIANAALHRTTLRSSPQDNMVALRHNTAAVKSLKERLEDPNLIITDEILGGVLAVSV